MTINISLPDVERDLQPKITVLGVGVRVVMQLII